ncbi:calcium-binding protein [Pseudophaeobacter sp.]|uniref:calcium-binding protein n=1 Tax=Pseudophaeobacter sp. TaxID=1971739 RepID=UPI0032989F20
MEFEFQQRFLTGSDRFDADLRDLEVVQSESGSWLYASNGANGGLSLYRLDGSAAAPQLLQRYWHENAGLGTGGITCGEIGGEMRLLSQFSSAGALLSYEIGGNGSLSRQEQHSLAAGASGGPEALVLAPVSSGENAGQSLVYGLTEAGELKGWRLDASGQSLGEVATGGGSAGYQLPGQSALELSADGGLLFALDAMGQGVRSYRITAQTGALQAADSLGMGEGLPVAGPSALQSFQAYGATWLLLTAAGTGSLSLLRVAADGGLSLADQLNDTLATRFGGACVLELVQVGEHVLVLAAGTDDGLSLLRLLPSGQLLHVTSLAQAEGLGLENVTALETAVLGDQLEIYVSSGTAGGISRFSLDLSGLGLVRSVTQGGLWGGSGDDLLQGEIGPEGETGAVTLNGGAGDDILVASHAGSRLTGGAGADLFVVGPARGTVTLTDFRPGTDHLDLSLIPGLYSPAQLQVHSFAGGMRLQFGDSEIVVQRAGGGALSLSDIWPDGRFTTPDRIAPTEPPEQEIQYGGGGADQLGGSTGADQMQGLGGNDVLLGRGGDDALLGGDGNDTLRGGWGADTLEGELGDDMVLGGGGNDRLSGGAGRDDVQGHKGDDILWGGLGNDKLKGNAGVDLLYGGAGNDDLRGGTGNDRIWGEGGANLLVGQAGADSLFGGGANDTLKGGADADWAWGYDGDDSFRGGRGRDHLFGGNGNDSLSGDIGGDWLSGGAGADSFIFGRKHGQDVITDFTPGEDRIDLRGMNVAGDDFSDLEISQQSGGVLVVTGNGQILLQGLELDAVTADDFLF